MDDFSEWEFAESFTAVEAALLIEGKKLLLRRTNGRDSHLLASEVILRRMQSAYDDTHMGYALDSPEYWPPTLPSEMMNILVKNLTMHDGEASFRKWLHDNQKSSFQTQRFTRNDLQHWLDVNHLPSKYQFVKAQPLDTATPSGRWSWGNHHTELLGHLEVTARRYWQNYDPTDATTAPTNKEVAEWLVTERELSKKMADTIASMLRPDGLPTGPRK